MRRWLTYIIGFALLLHDNVAAQSTNPSTVNFNFNTQSLFQNGTQQTFTNYLSYTTAAALLLTLKIRTSGNLVSGSNSIPANKFTITVKQVKNAISVGALTPVILSTVDQVLGSGISVAALTQLGFDIEYATTGGSNFLVPAGVYTAPITCTLTNLALFTTTFAGTLTVTITNTASLTLQNGATNAGLSFTLPADYVNGVQVTQSAGLKLFTNLAYSLTVSTTSSGLVKGANSIPVSNINVLLTPNNGSSGITTGSITLATTTKTLATSTLPTLNQLFDVKYSTQGGNTAFINKPPGVYSTTLVYTMTLP